ncbi:hypothetical protein SLOPH_973 [Spraguea lophii 42_110]|uniref:Uncharacterized protein n=1 Tax=Spraguea lophii (strain 42_110) TaxID=1358809 RepID=S7XIQ7_SPRLO|nr:hypothetical protein SLOPH_973 [Spraguea lophii 42_110]
MIHKEIFFLKLLQYRYKNQYKNFMFYRKLVELNKSIKNNNIEKIITTAERLYEIISSNIPDTFYIPQTLILMTLSAKIFYFYKNKYNKEIGDKVDGELEDKVNDEIDEIFNI